LINAFYHTEPKISFVADPEIKFRIMNRKAPDLLCHNVVIWVFSSDLACFSNVEPLKVNTNR